MNQPRIAFCTTCKGRVRHLKKTLPKNIQDNESYSNAIFVIVDYGSDDDLLDYLHNEHKSDIESGKVIVYSVQNVDKFKMAHAKNVAHRAAIIEGADILVNMDADNYTGENFAHYIAEQFSKYGDNIFLWANMIKGVLARGISGRIVVTKNAFLKSGGYNEYRYNHWGPDDRDFNVRLRKLGYVRIEIDNKYLLAIKHTDKLRFKEYPEARSLNECYDDWEQVLNNDDTIVNFGHCGEALIRRNFAPLISIIPSMPTRIFGIGMHKTGTTSLHKAFEILGFESGHWETPHWAKNIWLEMKALNKSETVEQYYALCDLPIPLLYKELDQAYPGSKFILTLRDEQDWLRSVERHWSSKYNKFKNSWDYDCFTHKVHRELYGMKHFNAEIFLERYRKHNMEVLEYFKNRPDDLLIINIDSNSWIKICAFLEKNIPTVDYPKSNTTLKVI